MLSSSNSKNSSSEDDLVDLEIRNKHFLDYVEGCTEDLNTTDPQVASHSKAIVNNNISSIQSAQNNERANNNGQSIELKKKKMEPSTSKACTSSSTANVDAVYSILSMLGSINSADITSKFLEFSKNREMCAAMRLSGCISLLVQIIHSEPYDAVRQQECVQALHNIISCHNDDKVGRREARVMKLNEQLFAYCDALRSILKNETSDNVDRYPIQAIGVLMKISFDEEHRYAMCQLGALQTISTLIQLDHEVHGHVSIDVNCITLRRYAGMCLTNLTFGDGNNKALLCSNKKFMKALVTQINSTSDELVQVTASVIRNLSWRADVNMKDVLGEIETVRILTQAAMKCSQENTLKAILSALWNLSNHCAKNKAEFCEINGAIEFLVHMLTYESASKTNSVIENAGGILRNISTHIAMTEKFRALLRTKNCFLILLEQLKSPSLTVVSNACGTLGNLSAHSLDDQKFLRENGAIPMLRSLIYSKHKMISTGSTIALRHLLACKTNVCQNESLDSVAKMMDLKELPTLNVRKQKALEHELSLSQENYKAIEISPDKDDKSRDNMKIQNIEDDDDGEEKDEEVPTNFSKFEDGKKGGETTEYQETNLDQITDYSIRYAENQSDSEEEVAKPVNTDDTMKCYNTEGTPHAGLSSAASITDLRKEKLKVTEEVGVIISGDKIKKSLGKCSAGASGLQSPEKTVNYCLEGTPGNFSRNDSLSDLDENCMTERKLCSNKTEPIKKSLSSKILPPLTIQKDFSNEKESIIAATPKSVTFMSLAEETPLMFSRTSSMGSLSSAEPIVCLDDKSSVFSDFSRLASGIISPSELPDSPTQSIPHSPSRVITKPRLEREVFLRTPPIPAARKIVGAECAEDVVNNFHIEDTPFYSYAASSLSNLSFDDEPKISTDAVSKDFQLMKHPSCEDDEQSVRTVAVEKILTNTSDTAEQSDAESADDDILLESCINMGMNRASNSKKSEQQTDSESDNVCDRTIRGLRKLPVQIIKENPIDMMRSGAPPLLPPYLPIVDELNKFIVEDSPCNFSLMSGLSAITIESNSTQQVVNIRQPTKPDPDVNPNNIMKTTSEGNDFSDSLSSLSIESEDDGNLLSQAIAAGTNKSLKKDLNTAPINIPFPSTRPLADFCNDSVSSLDSCHDAATNSILEQCIQSGINKVVKKPLAVVTSSPKKSMLPTYSKTLKNDKKIQDKKDEDLLKECIDTGIRTNISKDQKSSIKEPKNVKTTLVVALDSNSQSASTITGVEAKTDENMMKNQQLDGPSSRKKKNENLDQNENSVLGSDLFRQESWTMPNGCSTSFELNLSLGSVEENILERSNEYPAVKLSNGLCADLEEDTMDVSNEFLMEGEKLAAKIENKHKDPVAMMKSVERLTQELVSTAEYLRKNAAQPEGDEISKISGSNTWNDENSFPSISISAPMIGSTNEDATYATEENLKLDDKTPTNENCPRINFKVGGEIGSQPPLSKLNFISYGPKSIETCSTMSNSTIVQIEAKRIANKISSMTSKLMDSTSSLDLENVRPPSSMDCISLNSFQEISVQQSPFKKKSSLMTGLVAKRALGHQMFSASSESVNSILNIENIRPPSIMDELLDSMISVDSIVSEIFDPTAVGISNYETALSDVEDSLTLRSCQDLSKDEGTLTGSSSDYSSVESTPKKKNMRTITPKQKRQSEKDRYKTYTIQVDMLLKEQQETESITKKSLNARQRRQEDRQRFETQVINDNNSPARRKENPERFKTFKVEKSEHEDDDLSIRAMTDNFEFIRNGIMTTNKNHQSTVESAEIKDKLNRIRSSKFFDRKKNDDVDRQAKNYDDDERQNSETESQRDLKNSLNYEVDNSFSVRTGEEIPKTVRIGKSSYVSPYRMTTRVTPMKNKSLKLTKSPIIAKVVAKKSSIEIKPTQKNTQKKPISTKKSPTLLRAEAPCMPIRQGTFVQDEPTLENVPVVNDDLPTSPPVKELLSKLKPPSKVLTSSKIPTTPIEKNSAVRKVSSLPTSASQLKNRSNSNASLKIPVMTPIRSNTGINLSNPKKNVSSRIAGIWKSGDKKESFLKKPTVTVSTTQLNCVNKLPSVDGTNPRKVGKSFVKQTVKRSSTCEEIV